MELAQRLEDVLTVLYDYEYIDIEKFYNDKYNMEFLELLDKVLNSTIEIDDEVEYNIKELYLNLDKFIQFETNFNSEIGDF